MVWAAAAAAGPAIAHAEIKHDAMFKQLARVELKREENVKAMQQWLEKNVFPSFTDCGTGKDDVAIDPKKWENGFLFEYYPASRGKPPTTPDFVPACYTYTELCFRRDPAHPLEFDMARYARFPDTNECGLSATRATAKEPYPKLEAKGAVFQGEITAKVKYWEKRTSYARIAMTASKRNAPGRARAGAVVVGVGYGTIIVDVYASGTYAGAVREAEFPGPFESPHRRFCYTSEIAARGGAECALE
jgi:hypothetical protein